MTLKQAIRIVEKHQKWVGNTDATAKIERVSPKTLGEALDVLLIIAKDYTRIYPMDKVKITPKAK